MIKRTVYCAAIVLTASASGVTADGFGDPAVKDNRVTNSASSGETVYCQRLDQDVPERLAAQMDCNGAARPARRGGLIAFIDRLTGGGEDEGFAEPRVLSDGLGDASDTGGSNSGSGGVVTTGNGGVVTTGNGGVVTTTSGSNGGSTGGSSNDGSSNQDGDNSGGVTSGDDSSGGGSNDDGSNQDGGDSSGGASGDDSSGGSSDDGGANQDDDNSGGGTSGGDSSDDGSSDGGDSGGSVTDDDSSTFTSKWDRLSDFGITRENYKEADPDLREEIKDYRQENGGDGDWSDFSPTADQ